MADMKLKARLYKIKYHVSSMNKKKIGTQQCKHFHIIEV